jgi:hypothetical protein
MTPSPGVTSNGWDSSLSGEPPSAEPLSPCSTSTIHAESGRQHEEGTPRSIGETGRPGDRKFATGALDQCDLRRPKIDSELQPAQKIQAKQAIDACARWKRMAKYREVETHLAQRVILFKEIRGTNSMPLPVVTCTRVGARAGS